MSLSHEVTIWCDGCQQWDQAAMTAADLRRELHARGWVTLRTVDGVKDYCPRCTGIEEACDDEVRVERVPTLGQ